MLLTEYNEAKEWELIREEGRAEGRAEGLEAERIFGIRRLMEKLHLSEEEAMDFMDIPKSEQPRYAMLLRQQ